MVAASLKHRFAFPALLGTSLLRAISKRFVPRLFLKGTHRACIEQIYHHMSLYAETKQTLERLGRPATKLRGQHFLVDENVLRRIVEASEVKVGDEVLEIGPGLGFLTKELQRVGAPVTAIELDSGFADHLQTLCHPEQAKRAEGSCQVIHGDILKINLSTLFGKRAYRVVANIPYNITSPIIFQLLYGHARPVSATLLVQKEVAERICAKPGQMNPLALAVQLVAEPKIIKKVPAQAFFPAPKVDSAILHLKILPQPRANDPEMVLSLAKKAFFGPRKKISTTLKLSPEQFLGSGLTGDERPAEISVEQWLLLGAASE